MSNGTPEIFEGGPEGPPGPHIVLSIAYSILWILAASAALVFDLTFLTSRRWLVATSIVLLAAALAILAKEMGFLRRHKRARHD